MKFYIATQKQENARPVRDVLTSLGHICTSTWIDLPTYASIPRDDSARINVSVTCQKEVEEADALILVSEPDGQCVRGGKHVETGIAIAMGKTVHVIGNRENVFHWHPLAATYANLDEFLEWLRMSK